MSYVPIEYPKMLFRGDEFLIVADGPEEECARADGFAPLGEAVEQPPAPKKRGRPFAVRVDEVPE